jgi:hypothetical protein
LPSVYETRPGSRMADVAAELVPELHSQELVDALVEASECD